MKTLLFYLSKDFYFHKVKQVRGCSDSATLYPHGFPIFVFLPFGNEVDFTNGFRLLCVFWPQFSVDVDLVVSLAVSEFNN